MEDVYQVSWLLYVIICVLTYRLIASLLEGQKQNLPPGPIGLPLVGYYPFLTDKPYLKFRELQKKYGKVFGFYLGKQYTIVIEDAMVMKEAFSKQDFLGRPNRSALSPDKSRISMSLLSGHPWLEQRRFILHSMKDLGLGKSRMEEHIKEELTHLIKTIQDFRGEPNEIKKFLASCTNNIILALTCGRRLEFTDNLRTTIDADLETITNFMGQTSIQSYLPVVMKVPRIKKNLGYERFREAFNRTMDFIKDEIEHHKKVLQKECIRDLVDDYLLEIEGRKSIPSTSFTDGMLQGNIMMLFLAGTETVRATIDWILYVLAAYPDVQQMITREIDDVIGQERAPTWLDHNSMPITQSVINEVLRWRPPVPINLQRCTLSDTTLYNYNIPKGTVVLVNIWSIHHDPSTWENPDDFKPIRFLTDDKKSTRPEFLVPFSIGRRSCPGQSLAKVEVFIFITTILKHFRIQLPEGEMPNFDGCLAIVNQPLPHKLKFIQRS